MMVCVVDYAPNCPIHDGMSYYGLQWFADIDGVLGWIKNNTKKNFYVKEIWDDVTQKKSDFIVKYIASGHNYIGAEVLRNAIRFAYIKQNPYGDDRDWIVEVVDE
jgi:hypothetical protein